MSEMVVELEIIEYDGVWYRKGLDWKGEECWEECEDGYYGEDFDIMSGRREGKRLND